MDCLASQIGCSYEPIRSKLPLVTQIPLLMVHVMQVQWEVNVLTCCRECGILRRRNRRRKWISARVAKVWIGEAAGRGRERNVITPRRRCAEITRGKGFRGIEEHP